LGDYGRLWAINFARAPAPGVIEELVQDAGSLVDPKIQIRL